jgi:hypothetical protein
MNDSWNRVFIYFIKNPHNIRTRSWNHKREFVTRKFKGGLCYIDTNIISSYDIHHRYHTNTIMVYCTYQLMKQFAVY